MAGRLVLASLAFVAALLVCEAGLRFVLGAWPFEPPLRLPSHLEPHEASLRWRFTPAEGRNRLGLRNREIGAKPEGTRRVLFLGDSVVWGSSLPDGELYTERLERHLNERCAFRPGEVEIVNAGVPGYTTFQELEFLRLHGLAMEPDLVLLGFVFNDLYYPYLHRPVGTQVLGREPLIRRGRFDADSFPGRLFGWSYLAHEAVYRGTVLASWLREQPSLRFERRQDFYLAWKPWGWKHTGPLLAEMKALLEPRGAPLVVVIYPMRDQLEGGPAGLDDVTTYPQRRLREICRQQDIPVLDLTRPLAAAGGESLFRDHVHLTPVGNEVVAKELERFFEQEAMLAEPPCLAEGS